MDPADPAEPPASDGPEPEKVKVTIEYGAVRSEGTEQIWMPRVWVNGWAISWFERLDREAALAFARREAEAEAAKYIGDWEITIQAEDVPEQAFRRLHRRRRYRRRR
jgi:hypothetical protein